MGITEDKADRKSICIVCSKETDSPAPQTSPAPGLRAHSLESMFSMD